VRARWVVLAAALAAPASWPLPARGQSPAPAEQGATSVEERARIHFEQGVALFRDGNPEAAMVEFRASYRLRRLPVVLYNIGAVERELRRYADAVRTFRRYLAQSADEPEERRAAVRMILAELEAILGELAIDATPAGASVFVDGELVGTAPLDDSLRLEPGLYEIVARLDGYQTGRQLVELHSRDRQRVRLELAALPTPPWYQRWWVWTTFGVVLAAGAAVAIALPLTLEPSTANFGQLRIEGIDE